MGEMFPRRAETVLPIIKYNQNYCSTSRIYKLSAACYEPYRQ